jgi:hypothetical protein
MFRKRPAPSILLATGDPRGGAYSLRVSSLVMSVGVHAGMILLLGAVPRGSTFQSEMPAFRPEDHKIVYYDFRKKKQTPDAPRTGQSTSKASIASRRKPEPAKPLIRVPAPQIKQSETMVARLNAARPQLPAPPPPAPRVETPKPASPPQQNPAEGAQVARKQAKAFVPPPPSPVKPRLAMSTPVLEESAPVVGGQSAAVRLAAGAGTRGVSLGAAPAQTVDAPPTPLVSAAAGRLAVGTTRNSVSLGAAPALDAPPTPVVSNGNAGTDVLAASVNPGERLALPGADQAGKASGSANEGAPSTGDAAKSGTRDAGIGVGEPKPRPPDVAPAMKAVLYSEKVRMGPPASLSVPLRPGARTLPRNIEARFQARNVFTMVVPIENFPGYGGDWIIWFAEKQAGGPAAAAMRAPVPFRKMEPLEQPTGERTSVRVQVAGILAADGKLGSISLLSAVAPGVEQAVVQDLQNWEFRPAARANTPADVEIILEIPYSLPVAVARR